jgi:hypothetical protein
MPLRARGFINSNPHLQFILNNIYVAQLDTDRKVPADRLLKEGESQDELIGSDLHTAQNDPVALVIEESGKRSISSLLARQTRSARNRELMDG